MNSTVQLETHRAGDEYHFTCNGAPTDAVIEAVAFVKGKDPVAIQRLATVIDPDALNAVFDRADTGHLTFRIEGLKVQVDASSDIIITPEQPQTIHEDLKDAANVLLLAPNGDVDGEVCIDLLSVVPPETENVLSITFSQSAHDRLRVWDNHADELPANAAIVSAGEFTRSASPASTDTDIESDPITIETIGDPGNFTDLGITLSERLSDWEDDDNQIVACFHSVTDLLQHANEACVFRFLHILTSRMQTANVLAHYHLDPTELDEATITTLRPLFDAVVTVDDNGHHTIETA